MDPIHPIVPKRPEVPAVESTGRGAVKRDTDAERRERERRRRRKRQGPSEPEGRIDIRA